MPLTLVISALLITLLSGLVAGWVLARRRGRSWSLLPDFIGEGVLRIDATGRILWASAQAEAMLGYPKGLPRGLPAREVFGGTLSGLLSSAEAKHVRGDRRGTAKRPDGQWFPASLTAVGALGGDRLWILRDLSDRQTLDRLRASEERYNASQKFANIGVWDWVVDTDELYWSDEIYGMFGFHPGAVAPSYRLFCDMVHPDDSERVAEGERACIQEGKRHDEEYRVVWHDGTVRWLRETGDILHDAEGRPRRMVGVVRDITEERETHGRALVAARNDPLTGLPNRMRFHHHLREALARCDETQASLALAFIDLDRFKPINDTHGHAVGDKVLIALAARLRDGQGAADLVARVGGDEFVAVLPGRRDRAEVRAAVERLRNALVRPLIIDGLTHQVGASVGISLYPDHAQTMEDLINGADKAMYTAKRQDGGILFQDELDATGDLLGSGHHAA